MSAPRTCPGIRPRTWVVIILACLVSWAWTIAVAVWLLAGWWTS